MLINRAPPISLKLPSVLSCFVPTLGLEDSECLLVIWTMVKSREGQNAQMTTPTQSVTRSVKLGLKRGQIKGERPQEVHGPPSGSEAEAGGGKEPRAVAQMQRPVVTAHLGRPVIPSALRESSLPSEIRILILIIFSLVSYTKHKMRKLETSHTLPIAVIPEIRGG